MAIVMPWITAKGDGLGYEGGGSLALPCPAKGGVTGRVGDYGGAAAAPLD